MKVVYSLEQKREALALAREKGVSAASEHYGVAKNTIYRWKAAMELNGLLEENAAPAIENVKTDLTTSEIDSINSRGQDTDATVESREQPRNECRNMSDSADVQEQEALGQPLQPSDNLQGEDYLSRNRRLYASTNKFSPEIFAMILEENARLQRENQQLRRAMRALVEL